MIPGKSLKIARAKAGDTQKQAGERLGLTPVQVCKIEKSHVKPQLYTLYLALTGQHPDALNINLSLILE